jgi:ABC-type nitrate/sulfonate/bicarbonate transport system substrate-binding protein
LKTTIGVGGAGVALAGMRTSPGLLRAAATRLSSSAAPATSQVSLALGWIKNVEFAGLWLAEHNGYFAKQGIDAVIQSGGPNAPDPAVSVASGAAQVGNDSDMTSLIEAITKGNDFVMIGATYQVSPGCVVSLPSHPVTTPKDLVGIKFLGQQGVQTDIDAVLKLAHLPLTYTFIPVGYTPEPLVQHQGQAFSAFVTNEVITLEQQGLKQGKDFIVTTWAQLGLPSYSDIYFTTRKYLESNRSTLVRFMTAVVQGWEENMRVLPSVAARLAVDNYGSTLGLDLQQQALENTAQRPYMVSPATKKHGMLWIDTATLEGAMYTALRASGVTDLPPASRIVDMSILEEIYGNKTSIPV